MDTANTVNSRACRARARRTRMEQERLGRDMASASEAVDGLWPDHAGAALVVLEEALREPSARMAAVGDVAVWDRMILAAIEDETISIEEAGAHRERTEKGVAEHGLFGPEPARPIAVPRLFRSTGGDVGKASPPARRSNCRPATRG